MNEYAKITQRLQAIQENWDHCDFIRKKFYKEHKYNSDYDIFEYPKWFDPSVIHEWCDQYCKDEWVSFGGRFYFKNPKDTTFFILRWLET